MDNKREKNKYSKDFNDICSTIELFVAMFLLTVILSRWLYPIKIRKIKREELSALLLVYITTGGDIAELFSYVDESSVVKDFGLFLFIIGDYFLIFCSIFFYS
jgi:hypothetical protein